MFLPKNWRGGEAATSPFHSIYGRRNSWKRSLIKTRHLVLDSPPSESVPGGNPAVLSGNRSIDYKEIQSEEPHGVALTDFPEQILRLVKRKVSESTLTLYTASLRAFIRSVGDRPLGSVSPYHVELFMARRLEEVSPVRVNIEFRALRALFNRAAVCGMVNANPVAGLRQVRLPQQHPRALSRTEFPQLLSAIDNKEYRALVIVAVCTAMRAGEIAALRWTDVDLGSGVIHLVNRDGFRLKSLRARDVPLSRRATLALRSLLRRSERVFVKKRGTPSTPHGHSVWFKKYVRLASLPEDVHFHTLRHTGASMMVENNVPLPFIREILGHSSITTTMIYAHNAASHLRESVLRLDPIVGS